MKWFWPWMLIFGLMTPMNFAGHPEFSSHDYGEIFYPIWSFWHRTPTGWVFLITGDHQTNQGISIFNWDRGKAPTLVQKTSVREGIFSIRNTALSPSGERLLVRGFSNPMLFELNPQKPGRIRRSVLIPLCDDLFFWDEDRLVVGVKFPEISIREHGTDQSEIPSLHGILNQLPKDVDHPVEPYYRKNIMHISRNGDAIAVGFELADKVTVWNGRKRRYYVIGFPGYIKPPWKNPRNLYKLKEWFQTFHHLQELTWYKNELYAMFQHGYDDFGVWVKFVGGGAKVIWDNNKQDVRIFALERDELILGKKIVDTEEEVRWQLWQSSSLPLP